MTNGLGGSPKGSASADIGIDIDLVLGAAQAPAPKRNNDVVMLEDNELLEDEASPPLTPPTTVPLLAALSIDLASAGTALTPAQPEADWRNLLGVAAPPQPKGLAHRLGKKLWIAAVAMAIAGAAWAVVRHSPSSKAIAETVSRPVATATAQVEAPPAKAPPEITRPEEPRAENTEQAVVPGSSILAASRNTLGSASGDVATAPSTQAVAPRNDDSAHGAPAPRPTTAGEPARAAAAPASRHAPLAPAAAAPESSPPPAQPEPPSAPKFAPPPDNAGGSTFGEVDTAPPFDQATAMQALRDAGDASRSCRSGDAPSGPVRLSVTFARTGHVAQVSIEDAALAASSVGSCILGKFRAAAVPPFRGGSMTVRKTVNF
jgi:hypothetical protein